MDKYLSEEYVREIASHYDSIIFFAHSGDNNSSFIKGSSEVLAAHFVEGITRQEGFLSLIIASLMIAREQDRDVKDYIDATARAFLEDNLPKANEDIPYSEEEDED